MPEQKYDQGVKAMDYMKELNAFRNWQLLNPLSTGEVALWHTLMSLNNMTGWIEWFVAPNSTVQLLTGLSKQGVDNARLKLSQKRLLDYRKGNKGEAGRYKMLPVTSLVNNNASKVDQMLDQPLDQSGDNHLTNPGTDACPLLDLEKDIDKGEKENKRDRLLKLFNDMEIKGGGALGLDKVYSYIGVVDTEVIEMALKMAQGKHVNYFASVINGWIQEGKTTAALVNAIPQKGEYKGSGPPRRGTGKPSMPIVTSDDPPKQVPEEQRQRMLERARRLKEGQG